VDNIEEEKARRNESIVSLLQDFAYMEGRGYGLNSMVAAMRAAGLAPPQMTDNGASFGLRLRNHVLMSPEALSWLRQFDAFDLSPQERLALAYLRVNDRLYNRDYVRLTNCTSVEATQALRRLTEKAVVEMKGTRGGAYYTLPDQMPEPPPNLLDAALTDEERVLKLTQQKRLIGRQDVVALLGYSPAAATTLLRRLKRQGRLIQHGKKRLSRYSLPNTV
jgi:hypothetical protein